MPSRSRSTRPSRAQLVSEGVRIERNNLIIDASCYPPLQPKEEDHSKEEVDHPEEEDRQHAPHEVGRPESGIKP